MSVRKAVTCSAPVNIAVIKYWGKRDEELILPINSSLSVTLDQNEFKATTTIALSRTFPQDRIWLNGREELADSPRLKRCLEEVRRLALEQHPHSDQYEGHVHICSVNNFPTAAGLASSAAGYACLVYALSKLYDISGDISSIARQGSGSACRSVFGGFVKWERGEQEDGRDSVAVQVAPATHWSELEVLILVVSAERKMVSSTAGMQASVRTSQLLKHRAEVIVPQRIKEMEKAILGRDFQVFGKLTMQDSNQLHATCLDTFPPIHYLSATSHKVIQLATKYNELHGQIKVAYTFDAGPNAVLFVLSRDVPDVLDSICHCFPPGPDMDRHHYIRGISAGRHPQLADTSMAAQLQFTPMPGALQYILHTKVGEGPQMLSDNDACLLNVDGLPELS